VSFLDKKDDRMTQFIGSHNLKLLSFEFDLVLLAVFIGKRRHPKLHIIALISPKGFTV